MSWLVGTLRGQSTTVDYIRAKTNFNPSLIYSAYKSSNHKFSQTTKSVLTQIYIKQDMHKIFEQSAPVKKKST